MFYDILFVQQVYLSINYRSTTNYRSKTNYMSTTYYKSTTNYRSTTNYISTTNNRSTTTCQSCDVLVASILIGPCKSIVYLLLLLFVLFHYT